MFLTLTQKKEVTMAKSYKPKKSKISKVATKAAAKSVRKRAKR